MATAKRSAPKWRRGPGPIEVPDFVSFRALSLPHSEADFIRKIAEELHLRVESLPPQSESRIAIRGSAVFGSASLVLDAITAAHENLAWSIADGVLRFGFVGNNRRELSKFDKIAGRLMAEIKSKRLTPAQWEKIGLALDVRGFDLLKWIEPSHRKKLEDFYQGRSEEIPRSFQVALAAGCRNSLLRRAAKQRIHRARKRWEEYHATPAH